MSQIRWRIPIILILGLVIGSCREQKQNKDDYIDDSTMQFLNSLRPIEKLNDSEVMLNQEISVSDYNDFKTFTSLQKEISDKGVVSKDIIDSLQRDKDFTRASNIDFAIVSRVASYMRLATQSQKKLDELIASLTDASIFLTNKSNFKYEEEGPKKPAQIGLAYAWGVKDYIKRQVPYKEDKKDNCAYSIYGLDCSGFVATLFKKSGVAMIEGRAEDQRQVKYLKKLLSGYFKEQSFDVADLGSLDPEKLQTGDIIYILNSSGKEANHIGLILKNKSGATCFSQSSGQPSHCDDNLKRGPMLLELDKASSGKFRVVRIQAK